MTGPVNGQAPYWARAVHQDLVPGEGVAGVVVAVAGYELLGDQLVNRNGGQPASQKGGAEACLEKMAHEGAVTLVLIPQAERAPAGRTVFEAQTAPVRPRFAHTDVPFLALTPGAYPSNGRPNLPQN